LLNNIEVNIIGLHLLVGDV